MLASIWNGSGVGLRMFFDDLRVLFEIRPIIVFPGSFCTKHIARVIAAAGLGKKPDFCMVGEGRCFFDIFHIIQLPTASPATGPWVMGLQGCGAIWLDGIKNAPKINQKIIKKRPKIIPKLPKKQSKSVLEGLGGASGPCWL